MTADYEMADTDSILISINNEWRKQLKGINYADRCSFYRYLMKEIHFKKKDFFEECTKTSADEEITLIVKFYKVGEMSGTGVLSLPRSVEQSNWAGVFLIFACCILSGYCGIRLSSSWLMLLDKNESLRHGSRDPFLVIAYQAAGNFGKYLVLALSYVQLFGVAVIFLLLASENVANLLESLPLHFCDWSLIITAVMIPVAMFGTPKDFWPIAVGAMLFTAVACLLIFIQSIEQLPSISGASVVHSAVTFKSFFVSFGTILFCFGGAVMFPTIQSDMKNPSAFSKSVVLAYIVMLMFYVPVAVIGFISFGDKVQSNVIDNMDDTWKKTTVLVLITGHLLTAFNIILNPVYQGLEQALNAPKNFSLLRVVIRTGVLVAVLFVAQSIPNFGPILSFIGGSTVSLSSFILPCVFYALLCRQPYYNRIISLQEYIALAICIIISLFGGIASTYSSLDELFNPNTFRPPCYLNRTQ